MFFSRKKKIQRDRQAGLIFHWRGGHASNRGGMILATIIATSGFALAFIGINVYITSTASPIRHRAKVTQIGEMNNDLRWLVERNSPHLAPWYTKPNQIAFSSVEQKLQSLINGDSAKPLNWQQVDEDILKEKVPISDNSSPVAISQFPSLQRLQLPQSKPTQPVEIAWVYRITADNDLVKSRLPEQLNYPVLNPAPDLFGATVSFSVTLDEQGKLLSCLPLDWQTHKDSRSIQNWLTSIRFKPVKKTKTSAKKLPQTINLSVTLSAKKLTKPAAPTESP